MKKTYTVNIGNIGNIEFTNKKEAIKTYNEYVEQSKSNTGRAAGETVILLQDDEIIKEHPGTIDQQENDQEEPQPQQEPELLICDNQGIYIPQIFCQRYGNADNITNLPEVQEAINICLKGPDQEEYFEAWEEITDNAKLKDKDGKPHTIGYLPDSQDLWLIPENYDYPE